jgi:hypothetical protein
VFGIASILAGAVAGVGLFSEDSVVAGVAGAIAGACGGIATFGRFPERQKYHLQQGADYGLVADTGGSPERLAEIRRRTFQ